MIKYNKNDKNDITRYAKELVGLSFKEIIINYNKRNGYHDYVIEDDNHKGQLGHILEKYYFEYKINNDSSPDFESAELELKTTGLIKDSKNILKAKERLVISMIPYDKPISPNIENSELFNKLKAMLLVMYLYEGKNINKLDYRIKYVQLIELLNEEFKNDYLIIKDDYSFIANMIISGNAHKLSESLTTYLGACTKGKDKKSSLRPQYYNKTVPAQKRAFSLKQGYINYVIQKFIYGSEYVSEKYEKIIKNKSELKTHTFNNIVLEKLEKFYGWSVEDLCSKFNLEKNNVKNINNLIVNNILGIKSNMAEEFVKADVVVKTIRLDKNKEIRESMSFPTIKFKEFTETSYKNSFIYQYFSEKKFLFVIFQQKDNGEYYLKSAMFWNMPYNDLELEMKKEYEFYRRHINSGVKFKIENGIVKNSLPKKVDTRIIHLRPHSAKSYYIIDGKAIGNGKISDSDILPNGNWMTKQCFFLNNSYVKEQIKIAFIKNAEEKKWN
ncbi:Sau3AI family type II restriction endonuclease [Mycoplasma sp. 005V]|uniref:Sau3AI family type II restriction endonuclease n=1 Tax=Mycoplasma sp. 005V TaxID=3398776 RepID=UPI003A884073